MDKDAAAILPEGEKARRVYLSLRDQIAEGRIGTGERLPGEQHLAQSFGVSRVTVRRALDALSDGGFIEKRAGSGTRVRGDVAQQKPVAMDLRTLMPQLVEMGQSTTARLLSFAYGPAPQVVASALGVPAQAQVQIATRVRLADDTPFSHLTTYVPEPIARNYSDADLASHPLYSLLERGGVRIKDAHQSVSATLAGPDVADALGIAVGSALLSLRRVVRDVDGKGVEYLAGLYRPDLFRLEMPLERVGEGSARHWEPSIGQTGEAAT